MSELKILTFNVWGLAFVSKDRQPRLHALASYLASSDYDVVCLQELWIHSEFETMRKDVRGTFDHSRFYHTGALGSGLAVFSRYPIIESHALPYSLSGLPLEVIAGDFFVNKAAALAVIQHPTLGEVEIWNTHMHAGGEGSEVQQSHRMAQAWQLASEIRRAGNRWVFCMGDFNSQPYTIPIALLRSYGELRDSFLETHPNANDGPPDGLRPESALEALGITCDSPINSYSAGKPIPQNILAQGGKRLDYIFYRGPDNAVKCSKSEVVLTQLVPGQAYSYSDHFGLTSTFTISESRPTTNGNGNGKGKGKSRSRVPPQEDDASLAELSDGGETYELNRAPSAGAAAGAIRAAHETLIEYTQMAGKMATKNTLIAGACIVAGIVLAVGSAWQPKSWIQPIFTVVAFVLGVTGATYFYAGWLWGRWERGLLDEVVAEMDMRLRLMGQR